MPFLSATPVTNLDTLKLCRTALDEYNKGWDNQTVYESAYYLERLVLSKFLMNEERIKNDLQKNPQKDPKFVWQRHEHMTQKDARTNNTTMANKKADHITLNKKLLI